MELFYLISNDGEQIQIVCNVFIDIQKLFYLSSSYVMYQVISTLVVIIFITFCYILESDNIERCILYKWYILPCELFVVKQLITLLKDVAEEITE